MNNRRLARMVDAKRLGALVSMVCAAWVLGGCGSDADEHRPVTREACLEMCGLVACDADVTAEQIEECADRCMDEQEETTRHGMSCTDAYASSVDCFGSLECGEFRAWEAGDEQICGEALAAFEHGCPGLRFDFRE